MEKKRRLLGIDLCRGLAAFAVVLVHSGDETWGIPVSYWALQFRTLFYFAVPFFLAISFFFTTQNVKASLSFNFLNTKFQRILIPYAVWSIFYLIFGTIFFSITNQPERINEFLKDPIAIILLGSASYHLYFLPLLFSGFLLIPIINDLAKHKNRFKILFFLFIFSISANQIIVLSGNSFSLNPPVAFPGLLTSVKLDRVSYQIVRFLLMQVAWMLKCLPYICLAMILNDWLLHVKKDIWMSKRLVFLFFSIFIFVNAFREKFILSELSPVIAAFALLLFGLCLSNFLKDSSIIRSLGNCSFGIYLIHPILKKASVTVLSFAIPKLATQVTVTSILVFSISTFLISWLIVLMCMQSKKITRYVFGN